MRYLKSLNSVFVLFAIFSMVLISFTVHSGVSKCPDSDTYEKLADKLIEARFNYFEFSKPFISNVQISSRIGFVFIVAVLKLFFHGFWANALVAINLLFSLGSLWMVLLVLKRLSLNSAFYQTGLFALLLFSDEWRRWITYPISDVAFTFGCCLIIFSLYLSLFNSCSRVRNFTLVVFSCVFTLVMRPTAWPIIGVLFFSVGVWLFGKRRTTQLDLQRTILLALSGLYIASVVFAAYFITHHSKDIVMFDTFFEYIKAGVVVSQRPETYLQPSDNFLSILLVLLARIAAFFSPYAFGFSTLHNISNFIFYVPIYFCGTLSFFSLWMKPVRFEYFVFKLFLGQTTLFTALFHAVTLLDFDWRYRYPMQPFFLCLFGLFWSEFCSRDSATNNQQSMLFSEI